MTHPLESENRRLRELLREIRDNAWPGDKFGARIDATLAAEPASGEAMTAQLKEALLQVRPYAPLELQQRINAVLAAEPASVEQFNLAAHLQRQREWSERTFGPGTRTKGVVAHIRKELAEIEADPADIAEWIDVVILGLDGAWRAGHSPQQIIYALIAKQTKNENRKWPDWRTASPDQAIEHDRAAEPASGEAHQRLQELADERSLVQSIRLKGLNEPAAPSAPPPPPTQGERIVAVPAAVGVALSECSIGLFRFGDELCLKTEYGNNEGRLDAYIVSSGEFFWGDPPQTIKSQRAQIVHPVDWSWAAAPPPPPTQGEEETAQALAKELFGAHYAARWPMITAALRQRADEAMRTEEEAWMDERGVTWLRPTAWAYAQACRARDEARRAENEACAAIARSQIGKAVYRRTEYDISHDVCAEAIADAICARIGRS